MATAHDVASYILREKGELACLKLQKLLYYSQAWSLVWDDVPLFGERIEAWANGPVLPAIYYGHRGQFSTSSWATGDAENLTETQRETVDSVLKFYGDKPAQWLSDLTHQEEPWLKAREGLAPGQRGDTEITPASMASYYGSLPPG